MPSRDNGLHALQDVVRQSESAGTRRRAAILHTDRLPPALARPHHVRLARQALRSLAVADRAQQFELSRGRVAIVWRNAGGTELALARQELDLLLSGQPGRFTPALGELLTVYDLPDQALWLLDELTRSNDVPGGPAPTGPPLDGKLLEQLELGLGQADLSRFARRRPVMRLPESAPARRPVEAAPPPTGTGASPAWEERYFAVQDIAASLCPDRQLRTDPWLFRRLTRTLDARMLALLTAAHEFRGGTLALNLNIATMLSPDFLRFDEALPAASRGAVIINLGAADILSDTAAYAFARNFARARCYRLALAGASPGLLRFFDAAAAGISIVQMPFAAGLQVPPEMIDDFHRAQVAVVLTGLDRASDVRWAVQRGVRFGSGRAFNR